MGLMYLGPDLKLDLEMEKLLMEEMVMVMEKA
jgi:hypothetical protein